MTDTNLIETQNRRIDLQKKIREVQSSLKMNQAALKDIEAGMYGGWTVEDQAKIKARRLDGIAAETTTLNSLQARLQVLDANRMPVSSLPHNEILSWFKGNSLEAARNALECVAASLVAGEWIPGASRRVRAALNSYKIDGQKKKTAAGREEFQTVAMAPLNALFSRWDITRPAAKFLRPGTVSPTVQKTLDFMGAVSVDVCPMKTEYVEVEIDEKDVRGDLTGRKVKQIHVVVTLLWPEGTEHGSSRFGASGCNCEACGHAIKNRYNWVPMLLTTKAGGHRSLWVGRDCAKRLFDIEMTGDLEIKEG